MIKITIKLAKSAHPPITPITKVAVLFKSIEKAQLLVSI